MQAEMQLKFNEVNYTLEILKKHIDWDSSIKKLNELELLIENPKFCLRSALTSECDDFTFA